MSLESLINKTNFFYAENNIAIINKKPTPIKVVHINKKTHEITSAFFDQNSTVDYNGIYKGKYIEFEAKSTKNKTSFSLHNFQEHQIEYFKKVILQNGICFVIIEFSSLNRWFFLSIKDFLDYINKESSKSIPLEEIEKTGYELKIGLKVPLDFIKIIDRYFI